MSVSAFYDRERRYELGYDRRGKIRGEAPKYVRTPRVFLPALQGLGYHYCSMRHFLAHHCSGKLVVDHDHICVLRHSANNACPLCVRGLLCNWGNTVMAVWDEEHRARGTLYLPPEIADYIVTRPLT